jgi:PAS domain S-box-containing protein
VNAKPIELILLRQLASRLPMPASLVDAQGIVVYFNPPTERMLGYEHAVMGEFPMNHLQDLIDPRYPDRSPMLVEQMPLAVALHDRRPQQAKMIIHGSDGVAHPIVSTTIPLDGQGGVLLGAMSIFWEDGEGG